MGHQALAHMTQDKQCDDKQDKIRVESKGQRGASQDQDRGGCVGAQAYLIDYAACPGQDGGADKRHGGKGRPEAGC